MNGFNIVRRIGRVLRISTEPKKNGVYSKVVKGVLIEDKAFPTKELMDAYITEMRAMGSTSVAPAPAEHKDGRSYYARIQVV